MERMIEDLMEQLVNGGGSDLHIVACPRVAHVTTPPRIGRHDTVQSHRRFRQRLQPLARRQAK